MSMGLNAAIVSGLAMGIAAGSAGAQWSITGVQRDLSLYASAYEPGTVGGSDEDSILDNSLNFQGMVEVDAQSGGFTSLQAMLSQESSLVGNVLSASSRRGLGFSANSGSSGGANAESSVGFDIRIDAATDFELAYNIDGVVPFGFASPLQFYGTPDGGTQGDVVFHFGGSGVDTGTLQPGNYTIYVQSRSEALDFFDNFNPDSLPYGELDVWDFQLTLVPAPATGTLLVVGGLFASRRRR